MRRVLALVAAVGMVAAALALRSRLDRHHEEQGQTLRLTCSPELDGVCQRIKDSDGSGRVVLTVEPAGKTADRLATVGGGDDPGLDGWLVPAPWPDIVEIRRRTKTLDPVFAADRQPLGRSPLVLPVWKDRESALASSSRCKGPVSWKCLGDAAAAGPWTASGGKPEWGLLKPDHADPDSDGTGLLILGQAVADWFGRTDLSTIDLDDDQFSSWFSALEKRVASSPTSPLGLMLTAGPAVYDAVGTIEADAGPALATSARRADVDLLYPSPMSTADVVLATAKSGSAASSLRRVAGGDAARKALAAAGWRVPGVAKAEGITDSPPLAPSNGLPPPGFLDALLGRWHEVTGR